MSDLLDFASASVLKSILLGVCIGAVVSGRVWLLKRYGRVCSAHGGRSPFKSRPASASPAAILRLVLGALALGGVLLLPSLLYLFRVFKASPADPSARLPQESSP
jgi:hypothetical protein